QTKGRFDQSRRPYCFAPPFFRSLTNCCCDKLPRNGCSVECERSDGDLFTVLAGLCAGAQQNGDASDSLRWDTIWLDATGLSACDSALVVDCACARCRLRPRLALALFRRAQHAGDFRTPAMVLVG